jgi:hypothetical protein
MKYSYIKPRYKTAITQEIRLILSFFGMTILMLLGTYGFLLYQDYTFVDGKNEVAKSIDNFITKIEDKKQHIKYIEQQELLAQRIYTQNTVLKDSITNLFDLVPQRITLSEAILAKNSLVLFGITPNKDVYNFMLQAPLRSIFQKTYSSFYPAQNGWLHFVSKNYIQEDESLVSNQGDSDED